MRVGSQNFLSEQNFINRNFLDVACYVSTNLNFLSYSRSKIYFGEGRGGVSSQNFLFESDFINRKSLDDPPVVSTFSKQKSNQLTSHLE
ncbi:MAG: hypothetical protein ACOVNU_03555 [Candidatus Kapaibacteriota bacterium]